MRFVPNPLLQKELEEELAFEAMLDERAQEAKQTAEAIAPRHTGHYADSFVVAKDGSKRVLGNTDFAAHWVEWGSANNPPYATLRRAVQAVGLHLREAPKP